MKKLSKLMKKLKTNCYRQNKLLKKKLSMKLTNQKIVVKKKKKKKKKKKIQIKNQKNHIATNAMSLNKSLNQII